MMFREAISIFLLLLAILLGVPQSARAQSNDDKLAEMNRETVHVKEWPGKKKVAVCFVLYVEDWGFGQGPVFRPDMVARDPDLTNESFREYAAKSGVPRVCRVFAEEGSALSLALNANFVLHNSATWKELRTVVPNAPIIAHGINNSSDQLPLGLGIKQQQEYVRRTLNLIEKLTGVRSHGWTSPSVRSNEDTYSATAAEGIVYTLDGLAYDNLTRIKTSSGSLLAIPYPPTTVDMGYFTERLKSARDIEPIWIDYVSQLAREAQLYPDRDATVLAIGIHPFVVGTPDGAAALRRVLLSLKNLNNVWVTDVQSVTNAANEDGSKEKK